ncbi:MAG TPA: LptF/LptG family permease [Gemmataceae bacterium]|nr:LptF/LptG family permease [Gemmataceae bacterium]
MPYVLDRLMVFSYVKSYIICLVSLLGLYIVVDLFMNVDAFAHANEGLKAFVKHLATYYAARSTTIFDRLSEMIVLLAAMFTIAWVQRNNELLPQLSAGISTHRVVRPVLFAACGMITLATLNQELLIPQLSHILSLNRDDPTGERTIRPEAGYEPNGILIWGQLAMRKEMLVQNFQCNIKLRASPGTIVNLVAKEARYIPPDADGKPRTGGWMLTGAKSTADIENWPRNDESKKPILEVLEQITPTRYFLKTQEVDFDVLTRNQQKWFYLASTWRIFQELGKSEVQRVAPMAVVFHMRLTRPILGMILVFLGLSVILRDQNRNVFISAGLCLGICAAFFAVCFACQQLGDKDIVSPALAAWLPVMIFGPLAFVMFDAIHT